MIRRGQQAVKKQKCYFMVTIINAMLYLIVFAILLLEKLGNLLCCAWLSNLCTFSRTGLEKNLLSIFFKLIFFKMTSTGIYVYTQKSTINTNLQQ